jgi:SNF2 family DNA or RNA helicase
VRAQADQRDPPTTEFLLSVRSGAVGITLTAANYGA